MSKKPWLIFKIFFRRIFKLLAKNLPVHQIRRFFLRAAGYTIGKDVFIGEDLMIIDELDGMGLLYVGDRAAIAHRVTLVISSIPGSSRISPFVSTSHGPITIGNDAWLGTGAIVMPNITIGEGAVVGAGSVVIKDVAPFTVVAGVPAKHIKRVDLPQNKNFQKEN